MALSYKGLAADFVPVDLLGGEQSSLEHRTRNPSGLVPCLEVTENGKTAFLNQSVAILEWLEETHPQNPLLPKDALARAKVRELVQIIGADTQPVQNLRVMQLHSPDQTERAHWARHWIEVGLKSFEAAALPVAGKFSFGDAVTMADLFLVPQFYNAMRFNVDVSDFPTVTRVNAEVAKLKFCQDTAPDRFAPAS